MQRRGPAAREGRSPHMRRKRRGRRQVVGEEEDAEEDDGSRSTGTPITITITRALTTASPLTTLSTRPTSSAIIPTSTTVPVTTTSTTILVTSSSESSSSAISISTATFAPTPSVVVPSPVPSSSTSAPGGVVPVSGAVGTGGQVLSTGAIVGVVIAVVLVLLAAIVFIVRKQYMKARKSRRATITSTWLNKGGILVGTSREKDPLQPSTSSTGVTFARAQAEALNSSYPNPYGIPTPPPIPPIPQQPQPPPVSYNNPPPPASIPIPPGQEAVVRFTFIPTLPDELSISNGETVTMVQEFDDGWALCQNSRGQQGMVPLECLDRGNTPSTDQLGVRDVRNSRRASSLNVLSVYGRS